VKNDRLNFAASYFRAEAEKRGWLISLHPDGAFSGQIGLPDGSFRYFVRSTYDINTAAAALVARDKALTKFYLRRFGYPVVPGRVFFSDSICPSLSTSHSRLAARRYSRRIGYPVMVKANSGSGGTGVELVSGAGELDAALDRAFMADGAAALVEKYIPNMRDYRILILDGRMLLAYERRPFTIVGDGGSTVRQLVSRAGRIRSKRAGRPDSEAIARGLDRRGITWSTVPRAGHAVTLLDVANVSQGGTAVEVTHVVHSEIASLVSDAVRDLGLRYCGVDILTEDIRVRSSTLYILELNASPTIHGFAKQCRIGRRRLMRFHGELLEAMAAVRP
jgi:D-alanine-D-alanine ligase-like ATP-grasp enzyme